MLEEIMRRGSRSLGTDVPSEREINRLAARSEEEFWLFEKMDEERRQKENYRSRLMEEHEVPEWAYSNPEPKGGKSKGLFDMVTGKRRRKEVVYADSLSDVQWVKAVESGEDLSRFSGRGKRDHRAQSNEELGSVEVSGGDGGMSAPRVAGGTLKLSIRGKRKDPFTPEKNPAEQPTASEGTSEDTIATERLKPETQKVGSWDGQILTWKTHKKKRSSYSGSQSLTSSDSRGRI